MPFTQYDGILYPEDVDALKRTFTRLCAERGLCPGDEAAASLAAQLVELRRSGIVEEAELLEAIAS